MKYGFETLRTRKTTCALIPLVAGNDPGPTLGPVTVFVSVREEGEKKQ